MENCTIKLTKLLTLICLSLLFVGIQSQVKLLSIEYKTDKTIINYQVPVNKLLVLNISYFAYQQNAQLFPIVEVQRLSSNSKVNYTINNSNIATQLSTYEPYQHQIKGQLVNFLSYYRVTFNEASQTMPGYFFVYIVQNNKLGPLVMFNKKVNYITLEITSLNKYMDEPIKIQFQGILQNCLLVVSQQNWGAYHFLSTGNSALTLTDSNLQEGLYNLSFMRDGFESCDMKFIINHANPSTDCGDNVLQKTEECDNGNNRGCVNCKVQKGYKCSGGLYSSSLCFPVCGDGILTVQEQCDNKNNTGCFNCKIIPGFICKNTLKQTSTCQARCGDGVRASTQQCDNGNQVGCFANCVQDKGFVCSGDVGTTSKCSPICGDGIRVFLERCDNGKKLGCLTCQQFDLGWTCLGNTGQISTCSAICGDGLRYGAEACDNGNKQGCSSNCKVDRGYYCTGATGKPSTCATKCGDMIKAGQEQCDNGNKPGCTNCQIDSGYACKLATNGGSYCYKV